MWSDEDTDPEPDVVVEEHRPWELRLREELLAAARRQLSGSICSRSSGSRAP